MWATKDHYNSIKNGYFTVKNKIQLIFTLSTFYINRLAIEHQRIINRFNELIDGDIYHL